MAIALQSPTSLLPIKGIRIATVATEIRYKNRDDVVLFELCNSSQTAAVVTNNQFCAAPVVISKQHLNVSQPRYLLINSGNANAGLGKQGLIDAKTSCTALAQASGCNKEEVLPFSTGVIGMRLPVERMIQHYPQLLNDLKENAWLNAAQAIMTTDTQSKGLSRQINLDGHNITLTGIAKGAGMIRPDMATMLAFVATDLRIDLEMLNQMITDAVDQSFHCITVDGDTSTNDACVLIATGQTAISFEDLSKQARDEFIVALNALFLTLAQSIVRDGEGITKFISIKVDQAKTKIMARDVAFTIAHSPLVKTAAFASDPNWGRVLAAVGRVEGHRLEINKLSLFINELQVITNGEIATGYSEEKGSHEMSKEEIEFRLQLGLGEISANVWTTDLSYDYVKINAEYRT